MQQIKYKLRIKFFKEIHININLVEFAQTESLLHSLERTVGGIGLHVNAEKKRIHVL